MEALDFAEALQVRINSVIADATTAPGSEESDFFVTIPTGERFLVMVAKVDEE